MAIKNIIFDLGNVLITYNPDTLMDQLTGDSEKRAILRDIIFSHWGELDDGGYTFAEFRRAMLKLLPENVHAEANFFFDNWHRMMPEQTNVTSLLPRLKRKGYRLFILSNVTEAFTEQIHYYHFDRWFDGFIISGAEKIAKPDPRLFKVAIDRYKLVPEECLFLDDIQKNCDAAASVGINAVRFTGDTTVLKNLL